MLGALQHPLRPLSTMILSLALLLFFPSAVLAIRTPGFFSQHSAQDLVLGDIKVPVELGVMSQCPDALLCENVFNEVLHKVPDKLVISLRYVAQ